MPLPHYLAKDTVINDLDAAIDVIRDVIRPHELDTIKDSTLVQTGMVALNYTLGKTGLRWLFTHHTYCFLELVRQIGTLAIELKNQYRGTSIYSLDASIIATIGMWLVRERAKEENRYLKTTVGLRLINEYMQTLQVPGSLQSVLRAEFRHHFQMYITNDAQYLCGLNYFKVREIATSSTGGVGATKQPVNAKRILPFLVPTE